jgi:hypothetical protein
VRWPKLREQTGERFVKIQGLLHLGYLALLEFPGYLEYLEFLALQ